MSARGGWLCPRATGQKVVRGGSFFARRRRGRLVRLCGQLLQLSGSALRGSSYRGLGARLIGIVTRNAVPQGMFRVGPVVGSVRATIVITRRVNVHHTSVLKVVLRRSIGCGLYDLSSIGRRCKRSITNVVQKLIGVGRLCSGDPVVRSRGFHGLLLSFTRSVQIVLVVVTSHIGLVQRVGSDPGRRTHLRITGRTTCLCTPLTRGLKLCGLGSRLRSLSLGCARRSICCRVGRGLGTAGRTHSHCVRTFVRPVHGGLRSTKLGFRVGKHAGSVRSVCRGVGGRKYPFRNMCSLFTVHVVLSSPLRGRGRRY